MTFLAPLFLAAAGAALVPLILHLMARRQRVTMPFSTVRFLKLAQRQSSTKIRMENFLLWLLRTMLLLLLALAFAKPVYRSIGSKGLGTLLGASRRDVTIVWDASYSMGYEKGSKKVWDDSKAVVRSIIAGLSRGDTVSIFLASDSVVPLIGEPTTDLDLAMATVKSQSLRPAGASLSDAAVAALETFKASHQEREMYIVTDGQSLSWSGFQKTGPTPEASKSSSAARPSDSAAAAGAKGLSIWNPQAVDSQMAMFVTLLGSKEPVNSAIFDAEVQPSVLLADTPPQVRVRITHTGPPQQIAAVLHIDGQEIMRRAVDLGLNSGYDLVFSVPPLPAGTHRARIELSEDGLAIDNTYSLLIKVREELPVVVVGSTEDVFFLELALAPGAKSQLKVRRVSAEALAAEPLDGCPCIFLCNALPLPGPALGNVEGYVRRGGVLVMFPGERAGVADYEAWASLPAKIDRIIDGDGREKRQGLVILEPLDPLFAGLKLPPGIVPSVTIHRHLAVASLEPDAHVLIGASAETPFLISRRFGDGRVFLFTVSANRIWSDLPLSPFFLPLIQQSVWFAAGSGRDGTQAKPSASFAISDVIGRIPEGAVLLDPDQKELPIRRVQKTGGVGENSFNVDNVNKPGYYCLSLRDGSAPLPVFAVNEGRSESDLRPIDPAEIPGLLGVKNVLVSTGQQELEHQVQEHRIGRPLSELVFWAILLVSCVELFVANRASRQRTVLSETLTVHSSGRVLSKRSESPAS